jgi:transposase
MMGHHERSEALFYYFRLENQVPEGHLLRLIEKHISFEFVRERLKQSYSETGRPSIDPELLLRILLIGYLYGITSERKLVEELRMHLAWRWFTGLGFDQEIPHHSTFSKNRQGRFQESNLFEKLFEQIVRQCVVVGLVQGQHLSTKLPVLLEDAINAVLDPGAGHPAGFPSCGVVRRKLASFCGKVVSIPAEIVPMVRQQQVRIGDVSGVEIAVIFLSIEGSPAAAKWHSRVAATDGRMRDRCAALGGGGFGFQVSAS